MNFKVNIKVCRVCMKSDDGHSLYKDLDLQSKFVFTTRLSLTPGDSMPSLICPKCTLRLKVSYDFIQLAHTSHKNLKGFLTKICSDFNEVTKISSSAKAHSIKEDEIQTILEDDANETAELIPASKENSVPKKTVPVSTPKTVAKFDEKVISEEISNTCKEEFVEIRTDEEDNVDEVVLYEDANFLEEESEYEGVEQKVTSTKKEGESQVDDTLDSNKNSDVDKRYYGYLQEYNTMLSEQNDNDSETVTTQYIYDNSEESEGDETAVPVEMLNIYEDNTSMIHEVGDVNQGVVVQEDEACEIYDENEDLPIEEENAESSRAESEQQENKAEDSILEKVQKSSKPQNKSLRPATRPKKTATKSSSIDARFLCVKCNRDFSTKTNLTRHMVTHEGVRPYGCYVCGKTFSQNGSLKQHMMTHTGEKPFVCKVCNRGFTQCKSLVFHMRRHTGEKPFPCEHCGMFFRQRDGLKTHILKHHMIRQTDGEIETHTCIICKQLLATKNALQEHMKKHMNSRKTMLHQSSSGITEENPLMELMTDDDMLYDNSFINEELALNIEEVSASAQIINAVRANTEKASRVKKFQCRKCYKCFAIKKNLLRHLTTHDVSVSELFQCTTCQVAFDTNYALRVHRVREHKETNINLNECEYCNITFSNANELSDHNNEVHDSLEQKCPECPDLHFKTQKLLVDHMLEHENLLNEIDDE